MRMEAPVNGDDPGSSRSSVWGGGEYMLNWHVMFISNIYAISFDMETCMSKRRAQQIELHAFTSVPTCMSAGGSCVDAGWEKLGGGSC